ncbi:MAG TPA: electron transfer flavoprotein subunit alpha [Acholeplasmataceae bacterium]|jgi:electron transfer flavoprotein alpha subunit|nr:electron transfer flavoprotein subunit alpha [Acholeplasmataceae bacterium]
MARIKVDQSKATPEIAEASVKLCPFGAIYYKDGVLGINEACRMCKLCVRKGAPGVFTLEEEAAAPAIDKNQWRGVTVFIEHGVEGIHPVSFELIGKARELAAVIDHPVYAVLFSDDVNKHVDEILSYGVDKVYCYEHPAFGHFNVEIYANAMEHFINNVKPTVILYGGTSLGRSFAPRVAARFRTGLTADCTILGMKPNTDLIQNRPAFGGNIMAGIVCPNHRPQMATVRYKIFRKPEKTTPHGEVVMMDVTGLSFAAGARLLAVKPKPKEIDISEADAIVAVGRPFKTPADFALAQELADLLGAQLAGTRPLVEAGLIDPRKQIGLSGRTVAPKLLVTLGVSGAVQFTAGMTGSQLVFSVCSDPNAPIFNVAHFGLVGDVFTIVPKLINEIKTLKGME